LGLSKESALQLDITTGGSFTHKTTAKGEALLNHILENTSFSESLPVAEHSSYEEVPLVVPTPLLLTYLEPTFKPSPVRGTMEEEEIHPLEFPFNIEDDLFKTLETPQCIPLRKDLQFR
jgi:hypothetical protein